MSVTADSQPQQQQQQTRPAPVPPVVAAVAAVSAAPSTVNRNNDPNTAVQPGSQEPTPQESKETVGPTRSSTDNSSISSENNNSNNVVYIPREQLRRRDIIYGRGSLGYSQDGNHIFRQIVSAFRFQYHKLNQRRDKTQFSRQIVYLLQTKYGSRFLKCVGGDDSGDDDDDDNSGNNKKDHPNQDDEVAEGKQQKKNRTKKDPASCQKSLWALVTPTEAAKKVSHALRNAKPRENETPSERDLQLIEPLPDLPSGDDDGKVSKVTKPPGKRKTTSSPAPSSKTNVPAKPKGNDKTQISPIPNGGGHLDKISNPARKRETMSSSTSSPSPPKTKVQAELAGNEKTHSPQQLKVGAALTKVEKPQPDQCPSVAAVAEGNQPKLEPQQQPAAVGDAPVEMDKEDKEEENVTLLAWPPPPPPIVPSLYTIPQPTNFVPSMPPDYSNWTSQFPKLDCKDEEEADEDRLERPKKKRRKSHSSLPRKDVSSRVSSLSHGIPRPPPLPFSGNSLEEDCFFLALAMEHHAVFRSMLKQHEKLQHQQEEPYKSDFKSDISTAKDMEDADAVAASIPPILGRRGSKTPAFERWDSWCSLSPPSLSPTNSILFPNHPHHYYYQHPLSPSPTLPPTTTTSHEDLSY